MDGLGIADASAFWGLCVSARRAPARRSLESKRACGVFEWSGAPPLGWNLRRVRSSSGKRRATDRRHRRRLGPRSSLHPVCDRLAGRWLTLTRAAEDRSPLLPAVKGDQGPAHVQPASLGNAQANVNANVHGGGCETRVRVRHGPHREACAPPALACPTRRGSVHPGGAHETGPVVIAYVHPHGARMAHIAANAARRGGYLSPFPTLPAHPRGRTSTVTHARRWDASHSRLYVRGA